MTLGAKYGCYLKCEGCGATIDGAQVTANPEPPLTARQGAELRRRAALRGWTEAIGKPPPNAVYFDPHEDWCPTCTASKEPK